MFDNFFDSIFSNGKAEATDFIICLAVALISGSLFSTLCYFRSTSNKSFFVATALIPTAVTMVIALVNDNLGVGVAIAGAFGLVRFRSAQGTAREICVIFIAMASGLAFGMGYLAYAVIFLIVSGAVLLAFQYVNVWERKINVCEKTIKISIPEDLNYSNAFDEVFKKYTSSFILVSVKSTAMGSIFRLEYRVKMKNVKNEKEMIDEIRLRNGNLEILSECTYLKTAEL